MENLVSSWCTTVQSLPQNYIFPEDARPGNQIVPIFKNCPVIDLEKSVSGDRNDVIQEVLQACQDSGFFQVINHGICDPNIITVLYQGNISGLQVLKDGQWFEVEPFPNAFVVNIGQQLKVISNFRFESVEHRVVTNSKEPRYTIASFISPPNDVVIEPAKQLLEKDGRMIVVLFIEPLVTKNFVMHLKNIKAGVKLLLKCLRSRAKNV